MSFTPGPWIASQGSCEGQPQGWWDVMGRPVDLGFDVNIAMIFGNNGIGGRAEPNARLIAQAPTAHQLIREALQSFEETADSAESIDIRQWIKAARHYMQAVEGD